MKLGKDVLNNKKCKINKIENNLNIKVYTTIYNGNYKRKQFISFR